MKFTKAIFTFLVVFNLYAHSQSRDSYIKISTSLGEMIFKLSAATPNHTSNFITLAKKRYFDSYDFNRVIEGFVIQGGETDSAYAAMEKTGMAIKRLPSEFNRELFHQKGALAAGRDDNKEKASFLGQIYIVDGKRYTDQQLDLIEKRLGPDFHFSDHARKVYKEIGGTPSLDQNYTVFGMLVKGMDVLDLIAGQKKSAADKPFTKVSIKISVLSKKEVQKLNLH